MSGFYGLSPIRILGSSAVAVTAPASDTNENILATITIPAGAMGLNGDLLIWSAFTSTGNTNVKTYRHRLGGIGGTVYGLVATTAALTSTQINSRIMNRGVANSQFGVPWGTRATDLVFVSIANVTSAIDTSAATTLVITAQKATGTDTITLEAYSAWLILP